MAKVLIDGKEYDTEKLPKEAVELINSIQFVDREIAQLQNQIKIHLSARNFYLLRLKQILEGSSSQDLPSKGEEELNFQGETIQEDKIKF